MFLVGGCDPGGPGHGVPAPNDVDDGGEARGDADGQAHGQEVAMVPEHEVSRGVIIIIIIIILIIIIIIRYYYYLSTKLRMSPTQSRHQAIKLNTAHLA